jgi:hypothetical protein
MIAATIGRSVAGHLEPALHRLKGADDGLSRDHPADRSGGPAGSGRHLFQVQGSVPHRVAGAKSKDLLIRDEDVQVLHGFDSVAHARDYLSSDLFTGDVVGELAPLLKADPDIRVFDVA